MAAVAKNADVVADVAVAVNADEQHGGRAPETSAAAAGVEECRRDVGKLTERLSKFKLNPAAKEFVPASLLPPSEINGGGVVAAGSASVERSIGGLSADAPEFVPENAGRGNPNNHSWRDRMNQYWENREECIRRTVYVTDIDGNVTEEYLAAVFSNCGNVLDCRICGDSNSILRYGFVEFATEYDARVALGLGGIVLGLFRILVFPSKTAILPINPAFLPQSEDDLERCSRTIYCTDIDKRANDIQVKTFFESLCGQVSRLRLLRHHLHATSIAFIEFDEAESALLALNCSGMPFGEFSIRVTLSKTPVRNLIH